MNRIGWRWDGSTRCGLLEVLILGTRENVAVLIAKLRLEREQRRLVGVDLNHRRWLRRLASFHRTLGNYHVAFGVPRLRLLQLRFEALLGVQVARHECILLLLRDDLRLGLVQIVEETRGELRGSVAWPLLGALQRLLKRLGRWQKALSGRWVSFGKRMAMKRCQ